MTEIDKVIDEIERWLNDPQTHLGDKTRRKILEAVIIDHFNRAVKLEAARNRAKDFLLIASVVTVLATLVPKLLEWLGITIP